MATTAERHVPVQALLSRAVLIIWQTRAAHKDVAKIIRRVEQGDPSEAEIAGGGTDGSGGGGSGGGYFSTP